MVCVKRFCASFKMSSQESPNPFSLARIPRMNFVDLKFKDASYQLRVDQLTSKNVAKLFNLIPETIVLVSADGVVSLSDDTGKFTDIDDVWSPVWRVQGTESSKRSPSYQANTGASTSSSLPGPSGTSTRWKPSNRSSGRQVS